jgi:phage virion morphogenesis protein
VAGVSLKVTVTDAPVKALFARLIAFGRDTTPVMGEIGGAMVASTQRRFERQAGPGGVAWKPSIRAATEGGQTLRLSGRLFQSLTHVATNGAVEWGSNVIYARIQQLGGTIRAKTAKALRFKIAGSWVMKQQVTIPARPYLGVDADDWREVDAILADHLARLGAAAGRP